MNLQLLKSRPADVGGIMIHRVLPQKALRRMGHWCFLDHAGPVTFKAGSPGMQVGPHPHIGLQTFTWMIAGEIMHRDSLGHVQHIRPGELNLMTAGHGIVHTEHSLPESGQLHAAQLWIALPESEQNTRPRFDHYENLPRWHQDHLDFTLLIGSMQERTAETLSFSELVGLDIKTTVGGSFILPARTDFEYGLMVLTGQATVGEHPLAANELIYLGRGLSRLSAKLEADTQALLLGGLPMAGDLHMWWNFVAHSRADISQAQRAWETGSPRFGEVAGFEGQRLTAPAIPW